MGVNTMAETVTKKRIHEPKITIAKRDDMIWWKAWLIRLAAIVVAMLLTGVLSTALANRSFGNVFEIMVRGAFGRLFENGKTFMLWKFLQDTAILLCLALAVTPAFKMKFWNCGAEGQALIGGLGAMICMREIPEGALPAPLHVALVVVTGIVFGTAWGVIPALFKAQYNTNETLFTLMMNYVATQITAYYVVCASRGQTTVRPVNTGALPVLANEKYLLNILVVVSIMVAMFFYLRYSKHGYEISVVGESRNTARYVGINVKKVIVRTMALSGAICGIAGVLLVAGTSHSINVNIIGGLGFTAILVSWLGQLNPFIMALMSALIVFINMGAGKVADTSFVNPSYSDIVAGIVILFVVGCEFFIRYAVKIRRNKKGAEV